MEEFKNTINQLTNHYSIKIGGSYYLHSLNILELKDVDDIDVYIVNSSDSNIHNFYKKSTELGFIRCYDTREMRVCGNYIHNKNINGKPVHIHKVPLDIFNSADDLSYILACKKNRVATNFYSEEELSKGKKDRDILHIDLINKYIESLQGR